MTVRPATNPVESGTRDRNFTGQNEDVATGSYDFLFRRLNNIQGRWISPDPLGIGAVDPSNPQSWIDMDTC